MKKKIATLEIYTKIKFTPTLANSDSVHKALTEIDVVDDSDVDSDFEFDFKDEALKA